MAIHTPRALGFLLCALLVPGCGGTAPDEPRPDVVLFLIDTLRADWIEPNGFEGETTPHLAALARESIVFEQAHSPAPWTLPSVVSILTGRHVAEHNVVHDRLSLPASATTLAELMRAGGYRTAAFFRNAYAGPHWGLDQGFDVSVEAPRPIDVDLIQPFLDEPSERPFFLYLHNTEPHTPLDARPQFHRHFDPIAPLFAREYVELTKRYRELTRVDFARGLPQGTTDNTEVQSRILGRLGELAPQVHNVYSISVRDADARVGAVVRALRERGTWDRTLFIVLADHGEEMGDHGGWQHDQSVYQELIHVPLIVHLPGGARAGERVARPVSLVDVFPTVLEVSDCPGVAASGASLVVPSNESGEPGGAGTDGWGDTEPRVVSMRRNEKKYYRPFVESRGDVNVAVRLGKWKAIFNVELDTLELYDLDADPGEEHEASAGNEGLAEELRAFAARRYSELCAASTAAGAEPGERDAATEAALRRLGYVGDDR